MKKTWQERFDEKFKIFEQVSANEADVTFAVEEDRERVKYFIAQILEEEKERLVEIILDKLLKLEARHKEKACIIANSNEYDEINMARFIENPLVRVIAFNHIDFVRELRDIINLIKK